MSHLLARAATELTGRPPRERTVATASPAALLVAALPAAPVTAGLSRMIDLACPHPTSDGFTDDKAWAILRDPTAVLCGAAEA